MTTRFGPTLITSKTVFGVNSLGVPGSSVPLIGDDGGSLMANDTFSPTDEVRALIITSPPGSLYVFEDSSFIYTGDGGSGTYEFYRNGVLIDTYTFTITIGTPIPYVSGDGLMMNKLNKLQSLGYTGTLQEMFLHFLLDRGATSFNLNQAQKEFLLDKAVLDKQIDQMWFSYFTSLGYPGDRNSKETIYWNSVV